MLILDPRDNEWKVMQIVVTALYEMEEYNASGRYPVLVAWNFEKNERVQVQPKDLLLFLKEFLDDSMRKLAKTKTKRAQVS